MESTERQLTTEEIVLLLSSRICRRPENVSFRKSLKKENRPQIKDGVCLDGNPPASFLGPFGEPLRVAGAMAMASPFRFSTKYCDEETDLYYYGYRYYQATVGRWLSQDPINDLGFRTMIQLRDPESPLDEESNLFAFIGNDPVNFVDVLGLAKSDGYKCCDKNKRAEGEAKLNAEYMKINKQMRAAGRPARGSGEENSCYGVNSEVLSNLSPIPNCWDCELEHRTKGSGYIWSPGSDHWVVVCVGRDMDGRQVKEISFDYWAPRPAGEDPNKWFRKRYPDYSAKKSGLSIIHNTCDGVKMRR